MFDIIHCILWIRLITPALGHLPSTGLTAASKVDEYCELADSCVHDTIPVCGRMGEDKRTFLDLCDLIEYGCDTNQLYVHIDDTPGCPVFKNPI